MAHHSIDQFSNLLQNHSPNYKSLIHLNIRSLSKHYDDLLNFLTLTDHTFSLVCLSETWLTPTDARLFSLPNYRAEFANRIDSRSGGSAIFVSNTLTYTRRDDISIATNKCESVWLELDKSFVSNMNTIIGSIYRSPSSSYSEFCQELDKVLTVLNNENKNIIIVGDININLLDPSDSSCLDYITNLQGHGLESLLTSPTRCIPQGASTLIDHILSNVTSSQTAGIIDFSITDHYPIFLLLESTN